MDKFKSSTIDFGKIEVPENLAKTRVRVMDIREPFADIIYQRGTGIACRALAVKIYNSEGATEYNEKEVELIAGLSQYLLAPAVMDGVKDAIEKGILYDRTK